jgi:type I restriction enzyme M protein
MQDIDGHLRGGIPKRDLDALGNYWHVMPSLRTALFESVGRTGYAKLKLPITSLKPAIFGHAEFTAFNEAATAILTKWKRANSPLLRGFAQGDRPKALIGALSEELLDRFGAVPLVSAYDVYQHLMDYWAETMQDDCYLIADAGWKAGAQPREIHQVKNKEGKLAWPEAHDYKKGRRRYKSDLIPATILVARYFVAERDAIQRFDDQLTTVDQQLDEMMEEHSGEDGLLVEVIEGEGEKQKITAKAVKTRLAEIGRDPDYTDERKALRDYAKLIDQQMAVKAKLKGALEDLEAKLDAKYPKLSQDEIITLVVDDKWLSTLTNVVQGELDRVSQTITSRIRQLSERYSRTLSDLEGEVAALGTKVQAHFLEMGLINA